MAKSIVQMLALGSCLVTVTGCAQIIAENVLGATRYADDQCLSSPLRTNDGTVLPAGTRGTFQEDKNSATFSVDRGANAPPIFYDITGQNWSMRSCD